MCNLNPQNIPQELTKRIQWVCWKDDPSLRKVPLTPSSLRFAKTNDTRTWGTYEEALKRYEKGKCSGVGFVFSVQDPYVGIDLDNCLDENGILIPRFQVYIDLIDSYTEVSPSGKGLHIIFRGGIKRSGKDEFKNECYQNGRYFTMTGAVWHERNEIKDGRWEYIS